MSSSIENIGENIRLLRTKNNLSQEQLALNAGVNTSYIGQIERGEKNPTIKTLEKISFALNIELIDLLYPSYPQKEGNQSFCNYKDSNLTPEKIKQYLLEVLIDTKVVGSQTTNINRDAKRGR